MRRFVVGFGLGMFALVGPVGLVEPAEATPVHAGEPAADAGEPAAELRTEDVAIRNGDFTVRGTVIAPAGEGSGRPGIVLVPGAGANVPRAYYRPHAEAFARAGIVAFIYDKRGSAHGYSQFDASIADLADDAIAGVRLLRERPDVNPALVGVHGHSEGGWTVLRAARRSSDVAFVVAVGASALPPERTQVWMNQTYLREAGVAESLLAPLGANLTRQIVAADLFRLAGHDPVPDLERLERPLLGVFGGRDRTCPPGESIRLYRQALDRGGHDQYALRVIPDASHEMEPSRDGFDWEPAEVGWVDGLHPVYVETVTTWVRDLAHGSPERRVDPAPEQAHTSTPLAAVAPYESPTAQLVGLGLLVLGFGSYPVIAVLARLRGRRDPRPIRWPARVLATIGLLVPVLSIGYLGSIMLTAGRQPGPVLVDRPLLWLVLQLAALAGTVAAGVLLVRWWRERRSLTSGNAVRLGVLGASGVLFVCWSAYWGLFIL